MSSRRIILACTAVAALIAVSGGATYLMARRPVAPSPDAARTSLPAPAQGSQAAEVAVDVTASACQPNELTVAAGRVTFAIHNRGARALEWEILNGVMVVDERENIAPGFTQKLTTKLEPGDYEITCGLLSNPKGKLHVAALSDASVKPLQVDLIGPLAEYRVYASYQIDALVEDVKRLADAVKSGDLDLARALFPAAHAHYARLAPIVGLFPDLDHVIDSLAADHPAGEADPAFVGFHRLEWGLFTRPPPDDLAPFADKLVADCNALQALFENLPMSLEPTLVGAAHVLGKIAPARINGDVDRYSRADLADLQANIEGVRKMVDLFQPLIAKADAPLSRALAENFNGVEATLAKYKTVNGAYESAASLSIEDRTALQSDTKALADELAMVRNALGLS